MPRRGKIVQLRVLWNVVSVFTIPMLFYLYISFIKKVQTETLVRVFVTPNYCPLQTLEQIENSFNKSSRILIFLVS